VTFHRAFDFTENLAESLETLADAGVNRILTSGGASTAAEGAGVIADLVRQAGPRLTVIAGGGIRENNVRDLVSVSGVREVHVRLTRLVHSGEIPAGRDLRIRKALPGDDTAWEETDEERVTRFITTINSL